MALSKQIESPTKETLTKEVVDLCDELKEAAAEIAKLPPVSHLSKAKIQFVGGLIGGIQEYREEKRLVKLINTPIYKEKTFDTFAKYIIGVAEKLVEKQLECQKVASKQDECYYGNVVLIMEAIQTAYHAWYNYSPSMADAVIPVKGGGDVVLSKTVDYCTKEEFKKLDLPDGVTIKENSSSTSGCFGVLLLMLLPTILFAFL